MCTCYGNSVCVCMHEYSDIPKERKKNTKQHKIQDLRQPFPKKKLHALRWDSTHASRILYTHNALPTEAVQLAEFEIAYTNQSKAKQREPFQTDKLKLVYMYVHMCPASVSLTPYI